MTMAIGTTYLKIGFIHCLTLGPVPALASARKLSQPQPYRSEQQNRAKTEHQKADQIDQQEAAASVLSDCPRKLPHIAATDRAARAEQDKTEPASQTFSFHVIQTSVD